MKIFISQPMTGRKTEDILEEREKYLSIIRLIREDAELIDSFTADCGDKHPIFLLGQSISGLSEADLILFVPGWEKSRGCQVEHAVVDQYNLRYVDL